VNGAGLLWRQYRFERRMFWRNPSAAFFNFGLPLMFLLLIASVFHTDKEELNTLVPGIAGMAVMATTFSALAFNVTFYREQGILKRVLGAPLPRSTYFGGIIASAVTNAVVQVLLIVALGHLLYDVSWPKDWLALAVFTMLGVIAHGSLGIAFSQAIPNFDAAPAYVNAVFLPQILLAGVFYDAKDAPSAVHDVAQVLPLTHLVDGLSGAMVRHSGIGAHWDALVILGLWSVVGAVLAVRGFSWEAHRQG
jgi:ABC-2 type transport system permease protein